MSETELSRLLFEEREHVEMLSDVVERQVGRRDTHAVSVVRRLDEYRAQRGW